MNRMIPTFSLMLGVMVVSVCMAGEGPRPVRILWLGSSSIYYHNQPKLAAECLTRAGMPAKSELAGRSGTGVHVYLREDFKPEYGLKQGQTVLEKIARERFDYVVLQIPAEFINGPEGEEHDKSLDVYCRAIREAGGQPVFYEMGWKRDDKAEVGRQKIFAAAVRNKVMVVAPCSTAWQRVRTERPDLELHNPGDNVHPGTLGLYLNLCCFQVAFTGKATKDMPAKLKIWMRPTDEQKKEAAAQAKTLVFDEYDAALSGWMKNLVILSKEQTIPADTARYFEKVAWEEYQSMQKRLREAPASTGVGHAQ